MKRKLFKALTYNKLFAKNCVLFQSHCTSLKFEIQVIKLHINSF